MSNLFMALPLVSNVVIPNAWMLISILSDITGILPIPVLILFNNSIFSISNLLSYSN